LTRRQSQSTDAALSLGKVQRVCRSDAAAQSLLQVRYKHCLVAAAGLSTVCKLHRRRHTGRSLYSTGQLQRVTAVTPHKLVTSEYFLSLSH